MESSMATELNKDRVVNVWRFNIPQLITTLMAAAGTIVTVVWAISNLKTDITLNTNDIKTIREQYQDRLAYVNTQLQVLSAQQKDNATIPFRVTSNEAKIDALNRRIDTITGTIATSVENIRKDLGDLGTKVEVQTSKIETLSKKVDGLSDGKISWPLKAEGSSIP